MFLSKILLKIFNFLYRYRGIQVKEGSRLCGFISRDFYKSVYPLIFQFKTGLSHEPKGFSVATTVNQILQAQIYILLYKNKSVYLI